MNDSRRQKNINFTLQQNFPTELGHSVNEFSLTFRLGRKRREGVGAAGRTGSHLELRPRRQVSNSRIQSDLNCDEFLALQLPQSWWYNASKLILLVFPLKLDFFLFYLLTSLPVGLTLKSVAGFFGTAFVLLLPACGAVSLYSRYLYFLKH